MNNICVIKLYKHYKHSTPCPRHHQTKTQRKTNGKITTAMNPFVAEKCPNGSYIKCSVCVEWDDERGSNCLVKLRNNYWIGYFWDHIKNAHHKRNCMKKSLHEEYFRKQLENNENPKKRKVQSIYFICGFILRHGNIDIKIIK